MKPAKRRNSPVGEANIDLTPIMSILVILIPILLFAFTFFEVKVQAVSAPRFSSDGGRPPEEKVKLTVLVKPEGFTIKLGGDRPDEKIPLRAHADGAEYDYPRLYARLVELKERYPDVETIFLGGTERTPWRVLARVMDTASVRLVRDRFDSFDEWTKAQAKSTPAGEPLALFPEVSLVVAD